MQAGRKKHTLYTANNSVQLIRGGREYFDALLRLINEASVTFHLQTYIYDEDETGRLVADALKKAAQRGVKVYLLLDGYASQSLTKKFVQNLKESGVHFRWFEPILKSRHFYFGRRLHHKVAVADACHSLVGGVNISNKYNDINQQPAWLDWAVWSTGEISLQLHRICVRVWNKSDWRPRKKLIRDTTPVPTTVAEDALVRVRVNDWVRGRNQISRTYLEMLRNATDSVTIMSSYFLPGRAIKRNLAAAVKRGVKVKLIIAGQSDVVIAKQAERWMYAWLFRHNIEVYEYRRNVLHGKVSTCDGRFVTIGSYNLNNISAFASVELNLDIKDENFAANTTAAFEHIMAHDCDRVVKDDFTHKNHLLLQLWQWICYQLIQVSFFVFTFYFRRQRD